jgi:hypothetical protein
LILDPDKQVQQSLRLLFATFRHSGSALATVKVIRRQGLLFPRRLHSGPQQGELVWAQLYHSKVLSIQLLDMVLKKSAPRLRGRLSLTHHVHGYCCLRDLYPQFQQLTVNPCAPHSGFALLISQISSRISRLTQGLPHFSPLLFQRQYKRNPFRCQAITVSGLTMTSAERHCAHSRENMTQSNRSAVLSLGRLVVRRCSTAS